MLPPSARLRLSAFTLLELVVVVVVLGVLAAVAIPTFAQVDLRTRQASLDTTLRSVDRDARALAGFEAAAVSRSHLVTSTAEVSAGSFVVASDARTVRYERYGLCRQLTLVSGAAGTVGECAPLPAAPSGVTATPGDKQVTVSWSPPSSPPSGPAPEVSGYEVGVVDSPSPTASTGPEARSTVLGPLVNNTTYSVRVRALGPSGPGEWSAAISVTPVAPGPQPGTCLDGSARPIAGTSCFGQAYASAPAGTATYTSVPSGSISFPLLSLDNDAQVYVAGPSAPCTLTFSQYDNTGTLRSSSTEQNPYTLVDPKTAAYGQRSLYFSTKRISLASTWHMVVSGCGGVLHTYGAAYTGPRWYGSSP